jgi:hypothetical protein
VAVKLCNPGVARVQELYLIGVPLLSPVMDHGAVFSVRKLALPSTLKPTDSVAGEGAVNATMVQVPDG